jgi:formylglycine-generating enzyme
MRNGRDNHASRAIAWASWAALFLSMACGTKAGGRQSLVDASAGDFGHVDAAIVDAAVVDAGPPEPAGPVITGWEDTVDGFLCHHVAVERSCQDGWCRIPSGCFVMGSPETEFMRGMYTERLTAVTLTHAFEIAEHELTQEEWGRLVSRNPSGPGPDLNECIAPNCPVGHVGWFDAAWYANELSKRHDPPLAPCYDLQGCSGDPSTSLDCNVAASVPSTSYTCEGYRLPTEAEWEYAARAGTRTAYYSGDITVTEHGVPDPNLEDIAWYAANSGRSTHPVAQKRPNRWGLYDALGNCQEWVDERPIFNDPAGPLTDPTNSGATLDNRVLKGAFAVAWSDWLRVASRDYMPPSTRGQGTGVRLVRTLPE